MSKCPNCGSQETTNSYKKVPVLYKIGKNKGKPRPNKFTTEYVEGINFPEYTLVTEEFFDGGCSDYYPSKIYVTMCGKCGILFNSDIAQYFTKQEEDN